MFLELLVKFQISNLTLFLATISPFQTSQATQVIDDYDFRMSERGTSEFGNRVN